MHLPRLHLIAAVVLTLGTAMLFVPPAAAQYDEPIDVSVFYEELDEGGEWFRHPDWGFVWRPDVDEDWRPYTRGQWIYTDDHGWFWDSDEPWAWAVYHYGRWAFDENDGWIWVPGTRWAPAWVAWRYSDDYIGWAPLPPDAIWQPGFGIVYHNDFYEAEIFDPYWIFVRPRFFAHDRVYRYARPPSRNRHIIRLTRPATNYAYRNRRIVNRGIGSRTYRRITRRNLPRKRVLTFAKPRPSGHRARSRRGVVELYRPGKNRRYRGQRLNAPRVVTTRPHRPGTRRGRVRGPAAAGPGNRRAPFGKQQSKPQKSNRARRQFNGTARQPPAATPQAKRQRPNAAQPQFKGTARRPHAATPQGNTHAPNKPRQEFRGNAKPPTHAKPPRNLHKPNKPRQQFKDTARRPPAAKPQRNLQKPNKPRQQLKGSARRPPAAKPQRNQQRPSNAAKDNRKNAARAQPAAGNDKGHDQGKAKGNGGGKKRRGHH